MEFEFLLACTLGFFRVKFVNYLYKMTFQMFYRNDMAHCKEILKLFWASLN